MKSNTEEKAHKKWESPIIITVITALVGIIGTGAGAVFQGYYEATLEKQKFESNLIFKALEPEDAQDRAKYLLFLADSGLIDSLNVNKIRKLADNPEMIPSSNPSLKLSSASDILALSESIPGEIVISDEAAWNSWKDGNITYAASRTYIKGRVLAFGHDDILKLNGNQKDIEESFRWLAGEAENKLIAFSASHCEWVPVRTNQEETSALFNTLQGWNYKVTQLNQRITEMSLKGVDVLVIGNAWGSFSNSEIRAIENFVAKGGGLFTAGLGWSWRDFAHKDSHKCTGNNEGQKPHELATYPMNRLMAPFGARWTDTYIGE